VLPDSISVPAAPAIFTDGFQQLTAVALDAAGHPIPYVMPVWTSSDTLVAKVTSTGAVFGGIPGRAIIRAMANGRTGSAEVTVVPTADPPVTIIAHHGFPALYPENTVISIEQAFAAGADAVEVDVWLTRDEIPVLIHDATVDRTTNGHGAVRDLTYAQIQQLDACVKFAATWGSCRVPTLTEGLEAARGRGMLILDLKGPFSAAALASIVAQVRTASMRHFVVYADFDYPVLQALRRLDGAIPLAYLTTDLPRLDNVLALERTAIMPVRSALLANANQTQAFLQAAAQNRIDVATWVVTNPAQARALVDLGVRTFVSDVPIDKSELLR
jgi:glycerophosphoryl diester phosphodiesterase